MIDRWNQAWLVLRVHADAIRLDPATYARAVAWRLRGLKVRSRNSIAPLLGRSPSAYALWISKNEKASLKPAQPIIVAGRVVVPVVDCRAGEEGLADTIASLIRAGALGQTIFVGSTTVPGTSTVQRPAHLGKLDEGQGVWLCPINPGDRVAPTFLAAYAAAAAIADAPLVYADDDLMEAGVRSEPHFKPRWNSDLHEHHDFLTGASAVLATRQALESLPDEDWASALVDHALRQGKEPLHLPQVLHHRAERPAPRVPAKPVEAMPEPLPLVSAIIPTRNQLALLQSCVDGLKRCAYPRIETIIIDNDSDDPEAIEYLSALEAEGVTVLRIPGAFNFSRLNNAAVRAATGDLLCFLNNDVEMVEDDWLDLLVRQAMRPEIGAVGARLLYPDRTIQHAGVFTGIGGGAGHGHRFQREDEAGYFHRARLPQQVSAVTAACLVVAREKFLAVEGFDEQDFPVAFNDVDLCLKLVASGWQSLYEPRAMLIHHESKSRGSDAASANRVRFAGELAALKRKWHTDRQADPYHHPHLSRFSEQFVIAV